MVAIAIGLFLVFVALMLVAGVLAALWRRVDELAMPLQEGVIYADADTPKASHASPFAQMQAALLADPDYARTWKDNIAMYLHDNAGITDYEERNRIAAGMLEYLFDLHLKK